MSSLQKVAVVVGVGPGAGGAIARKFATEGFHVAAISRKLETLKPLEEEIRQAKGRAISVPCDCGQPEAVASAFEKIKTELGHPSVLIYNAGPAISSWPPPGIVDINIDAWKTALDVGLSGALYCAQQVLPEMAKSGQGTIIFTGASAALRGSKNFAQLAVPKFGLRALSQSIAREFQPQGVHVCHVIVDGIIDGPKIRKMLPDKHADEKLSADAIADVYWGIHIQNKTTWTQELDIRPYTEKF